MGVGSQTLDTQSGISGSRLERCRRRALHAAEACLWLANHALAVLALWRRNQRTGGGRKPPLRAKTSVSGTNAAPLEVMPEEESSSRLCEGPL